MAFHLPFFALRKSSPLGSVGSVSNIRSKSLRTRKSLSLLNIESRGADDCEEYMLYPTQTSCTLFGFDEWQFTVYSFVDTEYESSIGNGLYYWNDDDDAQGLHEDPLISKPSAPMQARSPIWRPRQYFAKALETAVDEVSQEWDQVVYRLEVDKKAYVCVQL